MSFSSAEWTIPELCVWIVTGSRTALNGLSPSVRESLKYSNMVHSGAYAARDEVIEAAQQGKIIITCAGERDRYRSNPDRTKLSRDFWNNAELEDAGSWMDPGSRSCVARRIDQPTKEYRDLLVDSAKAKGLWPPPEPRAELATAAPAVGGSISRLGPIAPNGTRVADADPASPNATDNDTIPRADQSAPAASIITPARYSGRKSGVAEKDDSDLLAKVRCAMDDNKKLTLYAAVQRHCGEITKNGMEAAYKRVRRKIKN
jgi:hypothetical protein